MAQKTLKGKFRVCLARTVTFGDVVDGFHDVIQDATDVSTTYYDDQFYTPYTAPTDTALLAQMLSIFGTAKRDELARLLTTVSKEAVVTKEISK